MGLKKNLAFHNSGVSVLNTQTSKAQSVVKSVTNSIRNNFLSKADKKEEFSNKIQNLVSSLKQNISDQALKSTQETVETQNAPKKEIQQTDLKSMRT
jgi:hypothetical protein